MPTPTLRHQLQTDGFVIQRSILSPSQLTQLRAAAARTTALARSGAWPHVRTVGKQFPPWTASDAAAHGIWGVQGLLNPELPDAPTFAESYFSDQILDVAKALLACGDGELVMELYNMLVRPSSDFELRWHRDDIAASASAEEEMRRLGEPEWHAQWNLALFEDESLIVVPGSHRRARTEAERNAAPFESDMPGQLVVKLGPGDVVFYNNNILHRGKYDASRERMSLHGSVGHVGGSKLRARNVLQHGVGSWVDRCDFSGLDEKQRERAEAMRARLVKLGRESGDVGYFSLTE
ncbi:phytanoyl-CoA dioxygenase [Whalleya microplaca]|nr:phytanoyl-CoA dioxygenase [Whalleya microplaca]